MRVAANRNMAQARLLVFVSCLLASISAGDGDIETGPSNIVVVVGQSSEALLECTVTPGYTRVHWYEFGTKPDGQLITDGNDVATNHPNAARYSIINVESGQFDLRISPVLLTDGTKYMCVDVNAAEAGDTHRSAQLITIAGEPNCTSTIKSPIVVEGDEHSMVCMVNFRASNADIAPVMAWTGPDTDNIHLETLSDTVASSITFMVTRSMDGQMYECITHFANDGFASSDPNMASNVPEWKHVWQSERMSVNWGPKDLQVNPDQPVYDVGMEIMCVADAMPPATISWKNNATGVVLVSGPSLVITHDMIGFNSMMCRAENNINGAQYSAELLINITVVTPTTNSTTTPSTTTATESSTSNTTATETNVIATKPSPPDVVSCSNVTGKWETVEQDQILWLNVAQNGVMNGTLQRGQTSPLALHGRFQIDTWNNGGLTIFNASSIDAYILQCTTCDGVETMTVSQLQRSEMSTCDQPGVSSILADVKFKRAFRYA